VVATCHPSGKRLQRDAVRAGFGAVDLQEQARAVEEAAPTSRKAARTDVSKA
jgi:hypothetical protein